VTDPAGGTISYGYDSNNNLTSVTYQDGSTRTYQYELPGFPNHLTGVTDENSGRYSTFGYDSNGLAVSSQESGGANAVTVTYGTGTATVTDGIGGTKAYS
jgi:YD repeat-containing protein